ncbi:MAG: hypothetical protein GC206_13280 [Alphaproteobacteria bacterium]|nr:hypothetical protein [Alphaproteobacteria bacterium]
MAQDDEHPGETPPIDLAAARRRRNRNRIAIERGTPRGPAPAPEMLASAETERRALRRERRALTKREGANGVDHALRRAWAAKAEWLSAMISMLIVEAVGSKIDVPDATIARLDAIKDELETEAARLGLCDPDFGPEFAA